MVGLKRIRGATCIRKQMPCIRSWEFLHLMGSVFCSEPMTPYYIFILFSCQFYTDLTLLTYSLPLNGLFQIHIKVDETEVSASWGWLLIHCWCCHQQPRINIFLLYLTWHFILPTKSITYKTFRLTCGFIKTRYTVNLICAKCMCRAMAVSMLNHSYNFRFHVC